MLIFVPVIVMFVRYVDPSQSYESCLTTNNQTGLCQPVGICSSYIQTFQQNTSTQVRGFFEINPCGLDQSWICCPVRKSLATRRIPTTSTSAPTTSTSASTTSTSAPMTSTSAPTLVPTVLKGELPEAPACGMDLSNRNNEGKIARIDEFPWLVQIFYSPRVNPYCVKHISPLLDLVSVRLGDWDTSTNPDCDDSFVSGRICNDPSAEIPVEEIVVHEKFSQFTAYNDIALMRLSNYINYTFFIQPICLPVESSLRNLNLSGLTLDVTGWGESEVSPNSTKKWKADVHSYPNSDCQEFYRVTDSQICAGRNSSKNVCNHDTGGPLMIFHLKGIIPHYFLAGLMSYRAMNCNNVPGVYTRISKYIDWIQSKIRD